MGSITPLVQSGLDAYSNLYDVEVTFPTQAVATSASAKLNYSVRIADFKPPELKRSEYKTEYKGISLTHQGPKIEGDRVFEFTYRIDANYQFHLNLMAWKHIYVDPSGDGAILWNLPPSKFDTANSGTVIVKAFDPTSYASSDDDGTGIPGGNVGEQWAFWSVQCIEAGVPAFARESGDPNKATAKFRFIKYREPGSSISGGSSLDAGTSVDPKLVTVPPTAK